MYSRIRQRTKTGLCTDLKCGENTYSVRYAVDDEYKEFLCSERLGGNIIVCYGT